MEFSNSNLNSEKREMSDETKQKPHTLLTKLGFKKHQEPTLDFLEQREHFIPIWHEVILEKALEDPRLNEQERAKLAEFSEMLQEHYHLDYHKCFLELKHCFAPFDPDSEVVFKPQIREEEKEAYHQRLLELVEVFLTAGNYQTLSTDQLNACLELQPSIGLKVTADTKEFSIFHIYYRGIHDAETDEKVWFFWHKKRHMKELKRIFIIARYDEAHGGNILVKQFRNIPIDQLQVMLPGVKLQLPVFAWLNAGGSFAGSLGTIIWKASIGILGVFALLFFLISLCVKSISGMLNARTKCLQMYSTNLYHKSLSNNVAAINQLVDQAETQEVKEAFLAYYALYLERNHPMTEQELDEWVEKWLLDHFGFPIDFEVDDALRKLVEKKLVETMEVEVPETEAAETAAETEATKTEAPEVKAAETKAPEAEAPETNVAETETAEAVEAKTPERPQATRTVYRVYNLDSALRRLDEIWDNQHTENNNGDAQNDTLAG